jgi:hypothetical protein
MEAALIAGGLAVHIVGRRRATAPVPGSGR